MRLAQGQYLRADPGRVKARSRRFRSVFARGPIGRHARLICIIPWREKGPLGRKYLAPRKDHRKSVRPLRNAEKGTRGRNKDARKTRRMAMRRGGRGGLEGKEKEFLEKEEPHGKTRWRKDKRMS